MILAEVLLCKAAILDIIRANPGTSLHRLQLLIYKQQLEFLKILFSFLFLVSGYAGSLLLSAGFLYCSEWRLFFTVAAASGGCSLL